MFYILEDAFAAQSESRSPESPEAMGIGIAKAALFFFFFFLPCRLRPILSTALSLWKREQIPNHRPAAQTLSWERAVPGRRLPSAVKKKNIAELVATTWMTD